MASYPYARVAHLTGLELAPWMHNGEYSLNAAGTYNRTPGPTKTPATITGNTRSISSYALCIGHQDRDGRGWWVYDWKSSTTTNRHVGTLKALLEHNGFAPTQETRQDRGGMGRVYQYRLYARKEG